MALMQKKLYFR